jgi:hypothetical protein
VISSIAGGSRGIGALTNRQIKQLLRLKTTITWTFFPEEGSFKRESPLDIRCVPKGSNPSVTRHSRVKYTVWRIFIIVVPFTDGAVQQFCMQVSMLLLAPNPNPAFSESLGTCSAPLSLWFWCTRRSSAYTGLLQPSPVFVQLRAIIIIIVTIFSSRIHRFSSINPSVLNLDLISLSTFLG